MYKRQFQIKGSGDATLSGFTSPNLGIFYVDRTHNLGDTKGSEHHAGPGEVGGPLAQRIDYVREFVGSGYALHFHGWLRRTVAAGSH